LGAVNQVPHGWVTGKVALGRGKWTMRHVARALDQVFMVVVLRTRCQMAARRVSHSLW
jgi:hypothetical protein